jgi:hypothetical protein
MKNHPHLAELYAIYKSESQPFRKVHRMIDLFESIIKTHTVVILGEYFKQNKYSNAAKGLLASGLRTPSLGTWQLFSRVLYKELAAENHVFFQEDFAKEFEKLDKDLENQKTNVISFRNEYAHGATPSDELCSEDIKRFEPFLESLLASKWLSDSTLLEIEGKVFISNSSTAAELILFPILLFKPEPNAQPYVFFNDLKNDKVGLLNYPLSKHYKEKDFFQEFNTYLPLKEWKNSGSSEFHQRIEELTETFKGRTQERLRIKEFIEKKDKGYFSIQGNPGIGKSALIAQLFKDLTNQTPKLPIKLVEYFIRRGTAQANSTYLLNYLLKATDTHFSEGKTIQAEGKTNWDLQQQLFAKWRAYGDANPKEKMVFFIDGLDEGVENDILRYLPRENFKDILVIYGSRPGGHKDIETFWTELPVENHQPLLLTGLSKNDIRALLYEVGNKYEIEKDSAWIDTVEKRSEGNPLYLKLLCNAIENGSIPYNDPKALPTEINDYYKAILTRYANDSQDGDALLSSLFVLAAAFDYLTPVHLQLINGFGTAQSIRIESTLKEVLYENPLTEEVLDYQLFHESFREFLVQFYPTELKRAELKLLEFCSTWNTLQHTFEQRYALQHYTSHLTQSSSEQSILTLINLSKDKAYTNTQKKVLRGFVATKQLYQEIIHHTIKSASTDEALEAALALVDLKYEEQNDAATILAMIANNEIDLALLRITAFGGESKEDKQRQFIMYMLCFMELTILESKTQPWRKLAIEKLLAQFEEQIPIDHSLVNWDDFFSSYLMFLLAFEWAQMDLDYLIIYKRTANWNSDWVSEKGAFSDLQLEVLLACAHGKSNEWKKSSVLASIATQLAQQGNPEAALTTAQSISNESKKSSALASIATQLAQQGNPEAAASIIQEAVTTAQGISNDSQKSSALASIATQLAQQGNPEAAVSKIQEAVTTAQCISDESKKSSALASIAKQLAQQGNPEAALTTARGISERYRCRALASIAIQMAQQGNPEAALSTAQGIRCIKFKSESLASIATQLAKQGNPVAAASIIQEALTTAKGIPSKSVKSGSLASIATQLAQQENLEAAASIIQAALTTAQGISYGWEKSSALASIATQLAQQGNLEAAVTTAQGISSESEKSSALASIAKQLAQQGNLEAALTTAQSISSALASIATQLAQQGNLEAALTTAQGISDGWEKSSALASIATQLAQQENLEAALTTVQGISNDSQKSSALASIATQLAQQGNLEAALTTAQGINNDSQKSSALASIATQLARQGNLEAALTTAQGISNDSEKSSALASIATQLARQGNLEAALTTAQGISDGREKSLALASVATQLAQQENLEAALTTAQGISDGWEKSRALRSIAKQLAQQGNLEAALTTAKGLSNERKKNSAIASIARLLAKQENWELAEHTGLEISQISERHTCWKEIAKVTLEKYDALTALNFYSEFNNEEAQTFYLKGWAKHMGIQSISNEVFCIALPLLAQDIEALEQFLQTYAIQVLFFENPSQVKIQMLNQTLNLQWALDVLSQFPASQNTTRLSTNLDTWLHEIEDEDDQDQITLWAKQVAKGKITEEEFKAKIKEFKSL